jgi:hypothetical protein
MAIEPIDAPPAAVVQASTVVEASPSPAAGIGTPPPSVAAPGPSPGWVGPPMGAGAPPTMMRSIGGLAASLTVLLWITVAVSVFAAVALFNRAVVISDILDFDFAAGSFSEVVDLERRADDADTLAGLAFGLGLLCALVVGVLLIIWMWRVAKNAELARRTDPRFGPGWTIGGWFVPGANLVIPVLVMQDLWRASDPTVPHGDPQWRRAAGSALVGWWWAAWLLATVRFVAGGEADTRDELETLRILDALAAVGSLASAVAAVLLLLVVRRITRRQESMLAGQPVTPD